MPDTTHAVAQVTHEFIPRQQRLLVLISSVCFSTRHLQFTFVRLLNSHLVSLMTLFNIDAHYHVVSSIAARCSLKSAPAKPISKGRTFIFCVALIYHISGNHSWHTIIKAVTCTTHAGNQTIKCKK